MSAWGWLLLFVGIVLASLPFVLPLKNSLRVFAFIAAYGLFVLSGRMIEAHLSQNAAQGWAFYAVTFLLFVVAGFPGFIWRYLWKK